MEVSTFANSIGARFDYPGLHRWLQRIGSFARHVRYDRRGLGVSDPVTGSSPPGLEQWCEDAMLVLDPSKTERAAVLGPDQVSGQTAAVLAATYPDRVDARVVALAGAGQVLVSKTVTDLLAGSGIGFASPGQYELKGASRRWEILAVAR